MDTLNRGNAYTWEVYLRPSKLRSQGTQRTEASPVPERIGIAVIGATGGRGIGGVDLPRRLASSQIDVGSSTQTGHVDLVLAVDTSLCRGRPIRVDIVLARPHGATLEPVQLQACPWCYKTVWTAEQ